MIEYANNPKRINLLFSQKTFKDCMYPAPVFCLPEHWFGDLFPERRIWGPRAGGDSVA